MRRRRKKTNAPILIILSVVVLCLFVIIGLKLTEKVATEFDKYTYPLRYTDIIYKYADEFNVPKSVILAMVKVESGFDPDAQSPVGACGLMQLMPDTFEWISTKLGESHSVGNIFDPDTNIKYGVYYISFLYDKYKNWECVYAAYNAGQGNVNKWLKDDRYSENGVLTDIPFEETSNHVKKLNTARNKYLELYYIGD